jgi:UDP-N-acetylmuramate dehydrogenase
MTIQENVPLAPLTTLQVGGAARYFCEGRSEDEIREAVQFANEHALPLFILGGGSNLLIADSGWPGLVLKIAVGGIKTLPDSSGHAIVFEVGAGVVWDDLVAHAVSENCAGIECLSGIPGSVGGTPVQNVGAYGQEVANTVQSVLVFDLRDSQIRELCNEACAFGYRTSIFNTNERDRFVILEVTYVLEPDGTPYTAYGDLKNFFADKTGPPTLAGTREAVLKIRAGKGMVITPGDADSRSAGSFFKNPVLTAIAFRELAQRAQARGLQIPAYPVLDAQHKVSAAWLVEHSGFHKGYVAGRVGISSKHALAIVNLGDATAADVMTLKSRIQDRVRETWGVELHPEPVFVGF